MAKKNAINILIIGIIILVAVILIFWISADTITTKSELKNDDVIAQKGIHWHPKLDIYLKGWLQTIPANVGIGAVHKPIHTHDTDNIIHLEFSGLVRIKDTVLGEFFKIWGKQFNANCIFDNCNGPSGTVKMFVNGKPNSDFEKYPMKDGDTIEIRYE